MQERANNNTTTTTMGFANENLMPNSGSTMSLSMSQRSSGGSSGNRDVVVVEHYIALKKYLTRHLTADGTPLYLMSELTLEGLNQRQNKAREKLIRLSKTQFNELSTDVYDEFMRRQNTQSMYQTEYVTDISESTIPRSQETTSTQNEIKHDKNSQPFHPDDSKN